MKIALASNHVGFRVKSAVHVLLTALDHEVLDLGPATDRFCDYPDYAAKAAQAVSNEEVVRAILVGGTSIGMSIVANKFQGVRAALCHDELSAELSRRQNDSNVLCLPANSLSETELAQIVRRWLETPFEGGRHQRRILKIAQLESELWGGASPHGSRTRSGT